MKERFTEEQIVKFINRFEAGETIKDLCREIGVSDVTFYNWKKKYAGLQVAEIRRMKELEAENAKLKRIVADLTLANVMLKDVNSRKW